MMDNCSRQSIVEIDLIQFFKRLFVQWRAIVAVAFVSGMLMVCAEFVQDTRTNKENLNGSPMTKEELLGKMTDEEVEAINLAVFKQKQIDEMQSYLKESVYMNMDATETKKIVAWYWLETDEKTDAYDVSYLYKRILKSDKTITVLKKELGLDCDNSLIREIYSVEGLHSDSELHQRDYLYLYMILPKDVDDQLVVAALRHAVEDVSEAKSEFTYRIGYDYEDVSSLSVEEQLDMRDSQVEARNKLKTLVESQGKEVDAFSDAQEELYQMIASGDDVDNTSRVDKTKDEVVTTQTFFNLKFFAIGVLAGIVLYVFLFFIYIILNSRAVELCVASITSMPCLGLLEDKKPLKKNLLSFLVRDPLVYNLIYKQEDELLSKPENIVGQMMVYDSEKKTNHFCIFVPGYDLVDSAIMHTLEEKASSMGVDITVIPVNISDVPDTVSKIDAHIPAVVSIYELKTKKKDIYALYHILKNQKVKVLGELYVR